MTLRRRVLAALAALPLAIAAASACACPADSLGTARVLSVDPAAMPAVGLKSFPATLPLADREVVLTFDDGPLPGTTDKVLAALAQECVRATFFLIGRNAAAHPDLARRILAGGHTVGHHSHTHPILSQMAFADAMTDVDRGFAAVDRALYGAAGPQPRTPFFRFPGFASTPDLLARLRQRGIAVLGADLWASDWNPMTPERQLQLVMQRLAAAGRGIVLFHDTKQQTAQMIPAFLRALKRDNYRVVHIVPPNRAVLSALAPDRAAAPAPLTAR